MLLSSGKEIEENLSSEVHKLQGDIRRENDRLEELKSNVQRMEGMKADREALLKEINEEFGSKKESVEEIERLRLICVCCFFHSFHFQFYHSPIWLLTYHFFSSTLCYLIISYPSYFSKKAAIQNDLKSLEKEKIDLESKIR